MFSFGGQGMFQAGGTFRQTYRCFPVSFIDKPQLEGGGKIILPASALDQLTRMNISYPMLFELKNPESNRTMHCGVLEFVAEEGRCYIPYWMMQNLCLTEGGFLSVTSASLPPGTFIKIQPQSEEFLDISNPKAVLENSLRNFSAVSQGDVIKISYNSRDYHLAIVEAKPAKAVCVIETDLEVDFAPPPGYEEKQKRIAEEKAQAALQQAQAAAAAAPAAAGTSAAGGEAAEAEAAEPSFKAFTGQGMRLDGKPLTKSQQEARAAAAEAAMRRSAAAAPAPSAAAATSSKAAPPADANKVVFGAGGGGAAAPSSKPARKKKAAPSEDEARFKAFSGSGQTLK